MTTRTGTTPPERWRPEPLASDDLLGHAYAALDLTGPTLMQATSVPVPGQPEGSWREQGEWLLLAKRAGADRLFFVGDDPVLIFAQLPSGATEDHVVAAYRKAWSLARPRRLFLHVNGELRVYALSSPPGTAAGLPTAPEPLQVVRSAAEVAEALAGYQREQLEAEDLPDKSAMARGGTAPAQLLLDVSRATQRLVRAGLPYRLAHALVERVVLVRYLEDRGVINDGYVTEVAAQADLAPILEEPLGTPLLGRRSGLVAALRDARLTRALFSRLARDFNGDLFVLHENDEAMVADEHLGLLRDMLTGRDSEAGQQPLFLWAYDFAVVPTSLISSMYEQFWQSADQDDLGTHYTPPELVEAVLRQALDAEMLDRGPRVCDPSCGSGIFLVEAFRRMVRHEMAGTGSALTPARLREILLTRIVGIDLNPEAVRLAAFSLYLALLNYQSPQDIRAAGPLPPLVSVPGGPSAADRVLLHGDAFAGPVQYAAEPAGSAPFYLEAGAFDVVVGNPPWTELAGPPNLAERWAAQEQRPVGSRSAAALFLWRGLQLLKSNGVSALLVPATVVHNSDNTSRLFRREWLAAVHLTTVVNFTLARASFFDRATAPFLLLVFRPRQPDAEDGLVLYRTLRPSRGPGRRRSLAYAHSDRRWVRQDALARRDYLWKVYAWGDHHDDALMARLDAGPMLAEKRPSHLPVGYGYQRGQQKPDEPLASLPSLKGFKSWGPLLPEYFEQPPTGVKRQPDSRLYRGRRLLVRQGVDDIAFGPSARLEQASFSFRHRTWCLPLGHLTEVEARIALGMTLSSLGRYRLFMLSGSWGLWHDSVVSRDLLRLPWVPKDAPGSAVAAIAAAVERIPRSRPAASRPGRGRLAFPGEALRGDDGEDSWEDVLDDLNEAVFEACGLTRAERDLVRDFHTYGLALYKDRQRSRAVQALRLPRQMHGLAADVPRDGIGVHPYLVALLDVWNKQLEDEGGELAWQLVPAPRGTALALLLETRFLGDRGPVDAETDAWSPVLARLSAALVAPPMDSLRSDGRLQAVTDRQIVLVKRNEQRLWNASQGRADAEATMLGAMRLSER